MIQVPLSLRNLGARTKWSWGKNNNPKPREVQWMEPPKICGWNMMEPLFEGAVPVLFGYCYTGTYGPYPRIMGSRKNPIVTPSFSPQLQGQFPAYTSLIHTYPYPLLVYTQYISVLYIAINIINPSNYVNNYVPIYIYIKYISVYCHITSSFSMVNSPLWRKTPAFAVVFQRPQQDHLQPRWRKERNSPCLSCEWRKAAIHWVIFHYQCRRCRVIQVLFDWGNGYYGYWITDTVG